MSSNSYIRHNLSKANLTRTDLGSANLTGANLTGANLTNAHLRNANLTSACLRNSNLTGANLTGANLTDANLTGTTLVNSNLALTIGIARHIIDGGIRSDGYQFLLTRTEPGPWRVKAGCRNFTITQAIAHWQSPEYPNQAIAEETLLIIHHMLAIAKHRGWPQ